MLSTIRRDRRHRVRVRPRRWPAPPTTAPRRERRTDRLPHSAGALSSDVAAKVKAAALEEMPGATVLRTESGGPYDTPWAWF
jgi:hypothetical protein